MRAFKIVGFAAYIILAAVAFAVLSDAYALSVATKILLVISLIIPAILISYRSQPQTYSEIQRTIARITTIARKPAPARAPKVTIPQAVASAAPQAVNEDLIAEFMAKRESLITNSRLDINELSKHIGQAVAEASKLEQENQYQAAINRLLQLERYVPLIHLPSADAQLLAAWLYLKLDDRSRATAHRVRAFAMGEILLKRIGKGASIDDPIRVASVNEIKEWANIQKLTLGSVKSEKHQERTLFLTHCTSQTDENYSKLVYFEIDPRTQAKINATISLYTPIPLSEMSPDYLAALERARLSRERFLTEQFLYAKLISAIPKAIAQSSELAASREFSRAIEALKKLEAIRKLEEIPIPSLIDAYSFLCGKAGDAPKQADLRKLLFGIHQAIAQSGDGLSPETAIHVVAAEEEYSWLLDKRLTRTKQTVIDHPLGKFDMITASNPSGETRDYYFNITRMFAKLDLSSAQ